MKNKLKIIIITFILVTIAFASLAFAGEITVENFKPQYNVDVSKAKSIVQNILGWIRNIGAIAATVLIAYFGLKFMVGSAEEKASYKKSFMPLIVGVMVITLASTIMGVIWEMRIDRDVGSCDHNCSWTPEWTLPM